MLTLQFSLVCIQEWTLSVEKHQFILVDSTSRIIDNLNIYYSKHYTLVSERYGDGGYLTIYPKSEIVHVYSVIIQL